MGDGEERAMNLLLERILQQSSLAQHWARDWFALAREENIAVVRPPSLSLATTAWMRPPPTDSLAAVVLRGAAFRSDFNDTACVPTPPASRCPIRHNIDGCTAAIPAVNALACVEQRRGHYRCDANALLPQLAATRSLVSHVIVPLEALGNTARWLGIPRVGHEAGMCPLGTLHP